MEKIELKPCPICGYPGIDGIMKKLTISTLFWRDSESEWGAAVNLGADDCNVAKGTSATDAALKLLEKLGK